jgi:tyrosinase
MGEARFLSLGVILVTLMVPTVVLADSTIQIELGNPGAQDDYVCWGPAEARIRLAQPQPGAATVRLATTKHDAAIGSGEVGLVDAPPGGLPAAQVAPHDEINVDLPADGAWKSFYVVGTVASTEDKDVAIVVKSADGAELTRYPLMVRVRKNAETLTNSERDRFLEAFRKAASNHNQFHKYWGIHSDGVNLAHEDAFMPWHRVFLLNFERELQAEDPSVALPYWEFDKPAPRLFTEDFIGRVGSTQPGLPTIVRFAATNPLSLWRQDPRVAPLKREKNGDATVDGALTRIFMQSDTYRICCAGGNSRIWASYHGLAHVFIGGLLGDLERSPADPLFVLLHANVDRAWAAWERYYGRFDKTHAADYSPQGHFQSSGRFGNYVEDTMWPWDDIARPSDPINVTVGPIVLPPNPGPGKGITGKPKVGEALDYLDMAGKGDAQNFCYDNIPYGTGAVSFWHP